MSHKIKVSYQLDTADEKAKIAVEKLLKSTMDWVHITENSWIVLSNRDTATTILGKIIKLLPAKENKVLVVDIKKKKIENDDGYIDTKNGEASEVLFTNKY